MDPTGKEPLHRMERRSFIPVAKRELRIRLKCDAASSSRCASDVGLVGWKTSRRAIGQFFSHLPLHFSQSDLRCATSLMSCSCFTSSSSIRVRMSPDRPTNSKFPPDDCNQILNLKDKLNYSTQSINDHQTSLFSSNFPYNSFLFKISP